MPDPLPADPPSVRTHKRQFVWQILLPVLLAVVLGLTAGGFTIAAAVSDASLTRLWADVSIIWLVAPLLALALILLFVLGVLIWGLARVTRITPRYTGAAQYYAAAAAAVTRRVADAAVQPIVWIRQSGAVVRDIINKLAGPADRPARTGKKE